MLKLLRMPGQTLSRVFTDRCAFADLAEWKTTGRSIVMRG